MPSTAFDSFYLKDRYGSAAMRAIWEDRAMIQRWLDVEAALAAYNSAPRDEAEERYGDYLDLVETGTDELVELRDNFAVTLDADSSEEYQELFNRIVRKRLPRFGLQLD